MIKVAQLGYVLLICLLAQSFLSFLLFPHCSKSLSLSPLMHTYMNTYNLYVCVYMCTHTHTHTHTHTYMYIAFSEYLFPFVGAMLLLFHLALSWIRFFEVTFTSKNKKFKQIVPWILKITCSCLTNTKSNTQNNFVMPRSSIMPLWIQTITDLQLLAISSLFLPLQFWLFHSVTQIQICKV
jgi:hypothetical protein